MATVADQPKAEAGSTAPLLLRIVLAVLALNSLAWFFYANAYTETYSLAYSRFEPWLWNLYLTTFLASLIGIFALWTMRQWGLWLLALLTLIMISIEIYAMGFTTRALLAPAGLAAVWFALQPHWNLLR